MFRTVGPSGSLFELLLPPDMRARVPDESTIRKLTRRLGPGVVDELNVVLLGLAAEQGHLSLDRVRVDTTVVEADIKYPTDSGLLTKAVSRIAMFDARDQYRRDDGDVHRSDIGGTSPPTRDRGVAPPSFRRSES